MRKGDDELAVAARSGDARALAVLYERYATRLMAYLERLLSSRADAEDALQDVFLRVFEGRGAYDPCGRFRAWLFTVAHHVAHDRLRRRSLVLDVEASRLVTTPAHTADERALLADVERVLADVPPSYVEAFHLRFREGMRYRDMAAILGEPEGTLRSRVHHTKERIRRALSPEGTRQEKNT